MNVIRDTESNFSLRVGELLANSSLFDPQVEERTRAILHDVDFRLSQLEDLTDRESR